MALYSPSALVDQVRGKVGGVVFITGRTGAATRIERVGTNPKTSDQRASRGYFQKAARNFKAMTTAQSAAWNAYGSTQQRTNPVTGDTFTLTGINAFVELGVKFLQVQPGGTLPLAPPTTEFLGDTITVTAAAGTGQITFTASGANALGVTTELLIQRLPSRNRKPGPDAYVSAGFKAFTSGSLEFVAPVPPGFYAAGYRFVRIATGQATDLVPLPLQTVSLALEEGGSDAKPKTKAA